MISMIAAMSKNQVIGYNNQMPWHLPADLQYFKQKTLNKPIIMGRKTFDSLGKALPQRRNMVVSRQKKLSLANAEVFATLEQAIAAADGTDEIMLTGGATIYQQGLAFADRMYLTMINLSCEGDTFFPQWDTEKWRVISRHAFKADADNPYDYEFVVLSR